MGNSNYLKLAWATLVVIFLVILAGSLVRMTGSGMGCPDWPKCFGYYIPPTDVSQVLWKPNKSYFDGQMIVHEDVLYESKTDFTSGTQFSAKHWEPYTKHSYAKFNPRHTWIEYINRLVGAVSGLFVFALFIMTFLGWRKKQFSSLDLFTNFVLLLLLGFQAWLGKTVVDSNLAPLKISMHMFGALAIVGLLLWIIRRVQTENIALIPRNVQTIAWIAFILILVQIYLGTEVRQVVDVVSTDFNYDQRDQWMGRIEISNEFKIHRSFAWLILASCGWIIYKSRQLGFWNSTLKGIGLILLGEVFIGIVLAKLGFPALGQPLHLMFACLLFAFLLWGILGSKEVQTT